MVTCYPAKPFPRITVQAEDSQFVVYPLTVEFAGRVPGFDWLTQVIVRLPENLPRGREYLLSLSLRGKTSNKARVRVVP